jgi:putative ABC transport system permease protein
MPGSRPSIPRGVFRLVLRLYPRAFRQRFGDAMTGAFLDRVHARREAHGSGSAARLAFAALIDTAINGLAERRLTRRRAGRRRRREPMRGLASDLRFAVRVARRQPGVTALSVLTFAVGIGASGAVFSVVDAALFRPVALPRPADLVSVMQTSDGEPGLTAFDNLVDWRRQARSFTALAGFRPQSVNLTGLDRPERVRGAFVTSDFFPMAGVAPEIGRVLQPVADDPSSEPAVVISHDLWLNRFGGEPGVPGRVMHLNNIPFVVVGVMPAAFEFPFDAAEVWMPLRFLPGTLDRSARSLFVFGRLGPGVTVEQALAEMAGINAGLESAYPDANGGLGVRIDPLQRWLTEDVRPRLGILFGLVLVLLAAAAANVAGLQVGATSARRAEIALRVALGAGRGRIARQSVVEHLLLAAAGGAAGLLLAYAVLPAAIGAVPALTFGRDRMAIDARVILFVLAVTAAAGLASAVAPALHWARQSPGEALKSGGRSTGERRLARLRGWLVAGQVGMAVVLLTAGGMLIQSYAALSAVDPGFDADQVFSLEYRLPQNRYRSADAQIAFHDDVVRRVAALPGVRRAASVQNLPFSGNAGATLYLAEGMPPDAEPRWTDVNTVSEDYFDILGIRLVRGRTFTPDDRPNAPLVAVASEAFARQAWPDGNAVGRVVTLPEFGVEALVIGVVTDVRHRNLIDDAAPALYASTRQNPGHFMTLVAEMDGDPMSHAEAVRQAIWAVDPDQPVWKERTLRSLVDGSIDGARFTSRAMVLFAAAAVLLVVGGIYGIVSQSVQQRAREIGVRMALGAGRGDVVRQVLRSGLGLTAIGLAVGLAASMVVARLMTSLLFGTSPLDAAPYGFAAGILVVVAAAASFLPARRALSVDPAAALRT